MSLTIMQYCFRVPWLILLFNFMSQSLHYIIAATFMDLLLLFKLLKNMTTVLRSLGPTETGQALDMAHRPNMQQTKKQDNFRCCETPQRR